MKDTYKIKTGGERLAAHNGNLKHVPRIEAPTETFPLRNVVQNLNPIIVAAGDREAGADCRACGRELELGESTSICRKCGTIHHESCWNLQGGCGSYECSTGKSSQAPAGSTLTISRNELAAAEPLPPPRSFSEFDAGDLRTPDKRWNRTAIWAFVIALLGIPLFGLVTGMVAIVVGCIALVVQTSNRRGLWMGVLAILIGMADVAGWAFGMYHFMGQNHGFVSLQEFAAPDLASIEELPEHLGRSMRANVIVISDAGFARQGMGSGVILKLKDGVAWIVTNRHVVDHDYSEDTKTAAANLSELSDISIQTVTQMAVPARIEWVAPHGVDLAILSTHLDPEDIAVAHWDAEQHPHIGDDVFAIGNPHGLGWTHSAGQLSQIRRRQRGRFVYKILQSTAALNPGNSGGGLYDKQGRLIGINTLTGDKRVAEGLGFSISLPTLLELLPRNLSLPQKQIETPKK